MDDATDRCPTCTRSFYAPYRRYDSRGQVIEGCVDACHTGKLVTPSESNRWHNSPQAKAARKATARGRAGKGYGS